MNSLLLITSILIIFIAIVSLAFFLTRRNTKKSVYFIVFTIGLLFYLLGNFLVLTSKSPDELSMAFKIENIGTPFLGTYFFLITLCLFNFKLISSKLVKFLTAYSFLMSILLFTNDIHNLFYSDFTITFLNGTPIINIERGVLYYFYQIGLSLSFITSYWILFKNTYGLPITIQNRYISFLVGSFFVLFSNIINIFQILPRTINFTPLATSITLGLIVHILKKYRILDIEVVATEEAIEYMDDLMIIFDYHWSYVYSNLSAKKLVPALLTTPYSTPIAKIEGMPLAFPHNYISDSDYSFIVEDKKGNLQYYKGQISPIGFNTILGWSVVIRNNTEVMTLLEKMQTLVKYDILTKIYNRRFFLEKLVENIEKPVNKDKKLTIIMFDLDHFKTVNDTYGHLVGDEILKIVAQVLVDNIINDSLVARYGGEEFISALIGFDIEKAFAFAEILRIAIEKIQYIYNDEIITITASFGVGQASDVVPDIYKTIAIADKALYVAKNNGRNRVDVLVE